MGRGSAATPRSELQERVQARGGASPKYRVVERSAPYHNREFVVAVDVDGDVLGEGRGRSKKQAEQEAARAALQSAHALTVPSSRGDPALPRYSIEDSPDSKPESAPSSDGAAPDDDAAPTPRAGRKARPRTPWSWRSKGARGHEATLVPPRLRLRGVRARDGARLRGQLPRPRGADAGDGEKEADAVKTRTGDKELLLVVKASTEARAKAARKMTVPPAVVDAHPHLLLVLENYDRALDAALAGNATKFAECLATATAEEATFKARLKTLGYALPKV